MSTVSRRAPGGCRSPSVGAGFPSRRAKSRTPCGEDGKIAVRVPSCSRHGTGAGRNGFTGTTGCRGCPAGSSCVSGQRAAGPSGATGGTLRGAGQVVQVGAFGVVELERVRDGVEDFLRGSGEVAPFQADVVVDADAGVGCRRRRGRPACRGVIFARREARNRPWLLCPADGPARGTFMTEQAQQIGGGRRTIGDFAPKFAELTDDVLSEDVWNRTELVARDRSLITVAGGGDHLSLFASWAAGQDSNDRDRALRRGTPHRPHAGTDSRRSGERAGCRAASSHWNGHPRPPRSRTRRPGAGTHMDQRKPGLQPFATPRHLVVRRWAVRWP